MLLDVHQSLLGNILNEQLRDVRQGQMQLVVLKQSLAWHMRPAFLLPKTIGSLCAATYWTTHLPSPGIVHWFTCS